MALAITSHIYNKDPLAVKKSIAFILDLIVGKDDTIEATNNLVKPQQKSE